MRVIAGSARSLPLKTVKSDKIRPTTDRIKETLFNILMPELPGCRFLDLFAGAGAIGIEALSRGAREAVMVDKSQEACDVIEENLTFTHLDENARVLRRDVGDAVCELSGKGAFDVIFMDPPYGKGYVPEVLKALGRAGLADEDTLVVAEEDLSDEYNEGDIISGFKLYRIKKYRSNRHLFFRRESEEKKEQK